MSKDDEIDCEFFITYAFDVKLIRIIGNVMIPSELSVIVNIDRGETATDAEIHLGLEKCKYWFEHIVSKTVSFGRDNTVALDMLIDDDGHPRVGNIFMMLPDDPRDELLGACFQAKINALAKGAFIAEQIDIKSDNLDGLSFILTGNHSSYLPNTMQEWLGGPSYFDVPWWLRDDASTFDAYLLDDDKKNTRPSWAFTLDFLDKTKTEKPMDITGTTSVLKPEFKPKIIDGGKPKK